MNVRRKRFINVASKRVEKLLKSIDLLSNCSNPSNYSYDKKDIDKMMKEINKSIFNLENDFRKQLIKKNRKFKF